jgi:hypothetical protein
VLLSARIDQFLSKVGGRPLAKATKVLKKMFSHLAVVPACVFIVETIPCRTGGKVVYTSVVMKLGYDLIDVLQN